LGMIHWQDAEGRQHRAPSILLPVKIEREDASKHFTIAYNGQEIEDNLALHKRFFEEFNVQLPKLGSIENLDIEKYIAALQTAIQGLPNCSYQPDEQALGLFSFGRHLMHQDLNPSNWPAGKAPYQHPVVRSIFAGRFIDDGPAVDPSKRIDDLVDPAKRFDVLNVDSSQLRVLEEIKAGKSLRVWGPPGTGKSTSIVNAIANAVAEGKKVLFVSEKQDALKVVKGWLDTAGIGDVALEIHSETTKKSIAEEIQRTLALGEPKAFPREEAVHTYDAMQGRLNRHVDMLRREIRNSGFSAYEALALATTEGEKQVELPSYDYR
ncbi:MAG: DUF4011 domain-containing protein, partial [Bdellovibrionales bacterium]|nr:DUF4011 domain-containing protein [Bdellovibrionales bacterium]